MSLLLCVGENGVHAGNLQHVRLAQHLAEQGHSGRQEWMSLHVQVPIAQFFVDRSAGSRKMRFFA